MYERYLKTIQDLIDTGQLTNNKKEQIKKQLSYYLKKGELTQLEYDELMNMLN